jgi:hypothetical protein
VTVFLGCGFAAKYPDGGGNFSVPLQWALGLKRLKCDFVWLELLPSCGYAPEDERRIRFFQRQLRLHGLSGRYCLLYQNRAADEHEVGEMRCIGMSRAQLRERLAGPNVLLNLSYSIHPPLLFKFERRVLCDLDPSEMFYWMTKLEMGQSHHHEFWTVGVNAGARDCRLPRSSLKWRTFFPLVDTQLVKARPKPRAMKFTTIGQWYWGGAVEVEGEFPDLSKKYAFEKYLDLPARIPHARFELAMNLNADDPEIVRLSRRGWRFVAPHRVAGTPSMYRGYIASAAAEFTAIKGVDVAWRTGWLSDRAAAFLASGRPVITEETGAAKYLPEKNAFRFVGTLSEAESAVREVCGNWKTLSKIARANAVELFDSAKNLRKILSR